MFLAFLLVMLVATLVLFTITRVEVETIGRHHYQQRVSFFDAHPLQPGDIAFLGDSLTAGGNWDELFPGLPIKNRGINADTTTGALQRLDGITRGQPKAIFMLIGTNDLPWYEHRHDEMILSTYQEMLDKIKKDSPSTQVFVESLLPRAHLYAGRVRGLNAKLQELAEKNGVTFINLYSHFVDARGDLRAELNNDHLHLLAPGYAIWAETLQPYLDSLQDR
jgi:lysophospholipase L1-like esterase